VLVGVESFLEQDLEAWLDGRRLEATELGDGGRIVRVILAKPSHVRAFTGAALNRLLQRMDARWPQLELGRTNGRVY
jgi:hypothetical protein